MTLILLSIWTCIIGLAFMVNSKYRLTLPRYSTLLWFCIAGMISTSVASKFNTMLIEQSPMRFFSGSSLNRFCSFMVGAGLGEEFWKMSCGLILILFLTALGKAPRASDRVLGMVTVGLTFAALENLLVYVHICDEMSMLKRGYLAVPLHACMGVIHGVAINSAIVRRSVMPMVFGYVASALIHGLYDTVDIVIIAVLQAVDLYDVMPGIEVPAEIYLFPIVGPLLIWSIFKWRRVQELSHPAEPVEGPGLS